jgi:hypothetical protein
MAIKQAKKDFRQMKETGVGTSKSLLRITQINPTQSMLENKVKRESS